VILIDAIVVKIRDGQVANRPVYVVMGVNLDGERDVLGLWVGPAGGEGAKFWTTVLTELRNRGVHDAFIVCCDGLKGLPEAIRATWPPADVQLCVVHLVRSSLRYTSKKHWGQVCREMREIYTAPTVAAAEARFAEFAETWRDRYPAMIDTWQRAWAEFVPFLDFPIELGTIVYTTNAIWVLERPVPQGRASSRALPQRASRPESPLPRGHRTAAEPVQPDRQDQRLEEDPEHPHHPLRRSDRRHHLTMPVTPGYTNNRTVPGTLNRALFGMDFPSPQVCVPRR
jgi:transposase-like protein